MDKETEIKARLFDFIYDNYNPLFLPDESPATRSENIFALVYIRGAFDAIDMLRKEWEK